MHGCKIVENTLFNLRLQSLPEGFVSSSSPSLQMLIQEQAALQSKEPADDGGHSWGRNG